MKRLLLALSVVVLSAANVDAGCLGVAERRAARAERRAAGKGAVVQTTTKVKETVKSVVSLPSKVFPCPSCK